MAEARTRIELPTVRMPLVEEGKTVKFTFDKQIEDQCSPFSSSWVATTFLSPLGKEDMVFILANTTNLWMDKHYFSKLAAKTIALMPDKLEEFVAISNRHPIELGLSDETKSGLTYSFMSKDVISPGFHEQLRDRLGSKMDLDGSQVKLQYYSFQCWHN